MGRVTRRGATVQRAWRPRYPLVAVGRGCPLDVQPGWRRADLPEVSPDLTQTGRVTTDPPPQGGAIPPRCPSCGALVRADAPWCTQCFFDLRPAPEPQPEPLPAARVPVVPSYPDPLSGPLAPDDTVAEAKGWPCTRCGTTNPFEAAACAACGSGFLAAVREDEAPLLVLPGVGDLTRMGRGQRLALAGGVVLVFVLVTLVIGLLLS